jgi:hypothetical protein
MCLLIILGETATAGGTPLVPTLQHMHLTCHKPRRCGKQPTLTVVAAPATGDPAALPE